MAYIPTAIELAAALRDGRATVSAPASVDYDAGGCVNSGAAWPEFEILIRHGEWELAIPVWYCCGWGIAANWGGSRTSWAVTDNDGEFRGYRDPRVVEDDDGGYSVEICGGDNIADSVATLDAGEDEAAAEAAAEIIGDAMRAAYNAVEIPEPDLAMLDESDVPPGGWEERYGLLYDGARAAVAEIGIGRALHPIVASGDYDDEAMDYRVPGAVWLVRGIDALADERYETRAEALEAVASHLRDAAPNDLIRFAERRRDRYVDDMIAVGGPLLFDSESDAEAALYDWAAEMVSAYDPPAGLAVDRDREGLLLAAEEEKYHLELDELMDCVATLAEHPETVMVTIADSLGAGNCQAGTAKFADELRRQLDLPADADTASAAQILALRDDAYTRRACRAAALRQARAEG